MSYLILEKGIPDFTKAVISLWFRVPKQTIADVIAYAEANIDADRTNRMRGVLPLLTFGPTIEGDVLNLVGSTPKSYTRRFASYSTAGGYILSSTIETYTYNATQHYVPEAGGFHTNPSFIGVFCRDSEDPTALLRIRIQMEQFGTGSWVAPVTTYGFSDHVVLQSGEAAPGVQQDTAWGFGSCLTAGVYPDGEWTLTQSYTDESEIWTKRNGPDAFESAYQIDVEPDKWHHLLISFDLSNSTEGYGSRYDDTYPICATTPIRNQDLRREIKNPCKMWIAFDDINYTGRHINSGYDFVTGDNDIAPLNVYEAATAFNTSIKYNKTWFATGLIRVIEQSPLALPTYNYTAHPVPSDGHPFGIPCVPEHVTHKHHHVEMAEFQMWTGKTLDTGIENNRRAFIDCKERDSDGNPVPDSDGKVRLRPVNPKEAEELLKKQPEVLLHGTSKWIKGDNTGSLGYEINTVGEKQRVEKYQFKPTGKIKKYTPDPSLEEETST